MIVLISANVRRHSSMPLLECDALSILPPYLLVHRQVSFVLARHASVDPKLSGTMG